MATLPKLSRVDISELKSLLLKKLGPPKTEKYFYYLNRFLQTRLTKTEFNKRVLTTIGKDNIPLHNQLIKSILKNALNGSGPPNPKELSPKSIISGKTPSGHFGDALQSPSVKNKSVLGKPIDEPKEKLGLGFNKGLIEVVSVEEGEEVEQNNNLLSPGVQSGNLINGLLRTGVQSGNPINDLSRTGVQSGNVIKAPIGLPVPPRKRQRSCFDAESCSNKGELPDTHSLFNRLGKRLKEEGMSLTPEAANLLNSGLNEYLKRIIKPCVDLVRARNGNGNGNPNLVLNPNLRNNSVDVIDLDPEEGEGDVGPSSSTGLVNPNLRNPSFINPNLDLARVRSGLGGPSNSTGFANPNSFVNPNLDPARVRSGLGPSSSAGFANPNGLINPNLDPARVRSGLGPSSSTGFANPNSFINPNMDLARVRSGLGPSSSTGSANPNLLNISGNPNIAQHGNMNGLAGPSSSNLVSNIFANPNLVNMNCADLVRVRNGAGPSSSGSWNNLNGLKSNPNLTTNIIDLDPERPENGSTNPNLINANDFRVAMELDPRLLGPDWARYLEKLI